MSRILNQLFEFFTGERSASVGEGLESTVEASWHVPAWIPLLLMLAAAAIVAFVYAREQNGARRRTRFLLAGIRITLIALVLFMMYGWMRERHRTDLPDVALVLDASASMAVADQFAEKETLSSLAARAKSAGFDEPTRMNLAKSVLLERDAAVLKALQQRYHVRAFSAGDATRALNASRDSLPDLLRELKADESISRLGKGVTDVLQLQRGRPTAALIMFTDGITTEGKSLAEVAEQARRKQVPLFLIGIGNDKPPRDVKLSDLLVDDVAFVNDQLHFDFKLSASGYEGKPINVKLRRKNDSRIFAETTVTLGKDGEAKTTRLTIRPQEKGEFEFTVGAEPLAGETTTSNNLASRTVAVSEETIRVLFVHGYPNYDFRYLKTLLGRELKSDLSGGEKAFTLKTVLQEADLEYAQQDETAERVFPVSQDDLFAYDVLIFGDCNPTFFGSSVLTNIANFVKVRGGGVVFLSGPRFTPQAFRDTPLAELFPVSLETVALPDSEAQLTDAIAAQLTPLGMSTPFLQLEDSLESNLQIWRSMPPLFWSLDSIEPRPGARVLVEHGSRTGTNGQKLPLVAVQFVGAGKVVFHATDETWRWSRHRDGEQYFARYWVQMLRYLSRSRLLGGNRTVQLAADRDEYQRGEPIRLRARFFDERLAPSQDDGVTVVLEREGSGKRNVQLVRDATNRGFFEGTISHLAEGGYRVWIATPTLEGQPPATRFSITLPQGEQARLEMDTADLRAAAKTSAGHFYSLADVDKLLADLPPGRQVRIESLPAEPIWNWWPWPALFVTLILSEWLLRKRAGML